jgi:AcrR family transcriptional regulator
MQTREPLTKDRVLHAALALADAEGIEGVTMRRIADELDVEAMSLYHHLPNKEAVLGGVVDLIFIEVAHEVGDVVGATPTDSVVELVETRRANWKAALRARILTARSVLLRHKWAPPLIESHVAISMEIAKYMDGVIGIMRAGGLSFDLIHHAMHALGGRAMGFVQELGDSDTSSADTEQLKQMAQLVPNLAAMLAEVVHDDPESTLGWCDDQFEFEFGLDIILDGLERAAAR